MSADKAHTEQLLFVYCATLSGMTALDGVKGIGPGNPFASSLISILDAPSCKLFELPDLLTGLTLAKSNGDQLPDVPRATRNDVWSLVPRAEGEIRIALVLAVSRYPGAPGLQPLPGAARDAYRVSSALGRAGFVTEVALDLDLEAMRAKLDDFGRFSRGCDAAVIYTTGHGGEIDGDVHLLPGAFPIETSDKSVARRHSLSLSAISGSLHARWINLAFYGGCRTAIGNA